jgi:hypothetical protein
LRKDDAVEILKTEAVATICPLLPTQHIAETTVLGLDSLVQRTAQLPSID